MIHDVCKDIMFNLGINRFIETGTFVGETVACVSEWLQDTAFGLVYSKESDEFLASFFPKRKIYYPKFRDAKIDADTKIYSVDTDKKRQEALSRIFSSNPNVRFFRGSSENFIKQAIDSGLIGDKDRCFFYLDAHEKRKSPLRQEIREILRLKRVVIVVDDFLVPFRPMHLFDVYESGVCGWYYIRDLFGGRKTEVYYPRKSNIDFRGTGIIFVGYDKKDLRFMDNLACFRQKVFKGDPFTTLLATGIFWLLKALPLPSESYAFWNKLQRRQV